VGGALGGKSPPHPPIRAQTPLLTENPTKTDMSPVFKSKKTFKFFYKKRVIGKDKID
jgi:hypothetical protein